MVEVERRDKLGLIAEWMDPHASLLRQYYFFFYPYDSAIELYDIKNNRLFLKRTRLINLNFGDIYVGNVITVFSRQFKLVNYANIMTERLLSIKMMKTFAMIKPDAINKKAKILQILLSNDLKIANLRMLKFSKSMAETLFKHEEESENFLDLVNHLQSGPSIVLEVVGENAVERLIKIAGPRDPVIARNQDPESIIGTMGGDEVQNAFYCSPCRELAARELNFVFENKSFLRDKVTQTAILVDSTCCIIKPHLIKEGKLGDIIAEIEDKGFQISAMRMFFLNTAQAEEFYEIYKGILVEFNDMVKELTSGGCVAMEIISPHGKDTPLQFRVFTGPSDPDIARKLRPDTLRARYGNDKVQNAVHASDLPTDGVLEAEYFFKVIQ